LLDRCLPPGSYRVRAEGEGYELAEVEVDARRGEVRRVTLSLALRRP